MASFFSEKSIVQKRRKTGGGAASAREERKKREELRLRKEANQQQVKRMHSAAINIQKVWRSHQSRAGVIITLEEILKQRIRHCEGNLSTVKAESVVISLAWWTKLISRASIALDTEVLKEVCVIVVESRWCYEVCSQREDSVKARRREQLLEILLAASLQSYRLNPPPSTNILASIGKVLLACTWDLPVTTHRKECQKYALFLSRSFLFETFDRHYQAATLCRPALEKVVRMALNTGDADVFSRFVQHIVARAYFPELLNSNILRINAEDNHNVLYALSHRNKDLLLALSPSEATTLLSYVVSEKFGEHGTPLFCSATTGLFFRAQVTLFHGRDKLPPLYRRKSSNNSIESEEGGEDEDDLLDHWEEVGDDNKIVDLIQARMRYLAGSPRRSVDHDHSACSAVVSKYIDTGIMFSDFDSLLLKKSLMGCGPIGAFIARWGSVEVLFQDDDICGKVIDLPNTGAPLRDLETAFPSLDPTVIQLVYSQCQRNIQNSFEALRSMGMANASDVSTREEIILDGPRCGLTGKDEDTTTKLHSFLLKQRSGCNVPRFAELWIKMNEFYDVQILAGNKDVANTVPGLTEAFLCFVTGLYLDVKHKNEYAFYERQHPFKLATQMSEIVLWLQTLMARLADTQSKSLSDMVLQLACTRLFQHLCTRHQKKAWIRNTSTIDSDMLAALDVDRQLRHEQDVAFQSALEVDLDRIRQEKASKESEVRHERDVAFQSALEVDLDRIRQEKASKESEFEVEGSEMQQPLLRQESRAERAARFAAAFDKRTSQQKNKNSL